MPTLLATQYINVSWGLPVSSLRCEVYQDKCWYLYISKKAIVAAIFALLKLFQIIGFTL